METSLWTLDHAPIQHALVSTQPSLQRTVSDKDIWYWPTGKVGVLRSRDEYFSGLRHVCIGLTHFLNYCWGVLDQAQSGFDDVITSIYLVSLLVYAPNDECIVGESDCSTEIL